MKTSAKYGQGCGAGKAHPLLAGVQTGTTTWDATAVPSKVENVHSPCPAIPVLEMSFRDTVTCVYKKNHVETFMAAFLEIAEEPRM